MTRISISTNAQTIMSILNSGETKDYEKVRASAGLTEKEMGAAIGWLLRENSIDMEEDAINNQCKIRLHCIPYGVYY